MNRLLSIAFGSILLMSILAWAIAPQPQRQDEAVLAASTPPRERSGDDAVMVLQRDSSGQFHLIAEVNGQDTGFLVDTGADLVALTEEAAADLGLDLSEDDFEPLVQTASGPGLAAAVRLDELTLGGRSFRDVDALVVRGLSVNLLGQSVLGRLGRVELRGDRMILHPR